MPDSSAYAWGTRTSSANRAGSGGAPGTPGRYRGQYLTSATCLDRRPRVSASRTFARGEEHPPGKAHLLVSEHFAPPVHAEAAATWTPDPGSIKDPGPASDVCPPV